MYLQKYCFRLIFSRFNIFGKSSINLVISQHNPTLALLHTTPKICGKLFVDRENQHAHAIITKFKNYKVFTEPEISETIGEVDEILQTTEFSNPDEIFTNFKLVTNYCNKYKVCISDDKFDNFIDIFTQNCHQFNDEQLIDSIRFIKLLPLTKKIYCKNFIEIWSALDDVCSERLENWDINKILLICDCWYAIDLASANRFVWAAVRKIGRKIKKLERHQLVHSLFFCNVVRKAVFEMIDYEVAFDNLIDEMSIDEIGVMSMGFFKTKTPIRNLKLVEKIYKRLLMELDKVGDITLVNILKILRYSSKMENANLMNELLEQMCSQINRISLLSSLHVALLGCDMQLCHYKCIQLIIEKFIKEFETTRLKDIERICHVMSLFNLPTDKNNSSKNTLCEMILKSLKNRIPEIMQYPKCFPSCLHYLTMCGYYDEELISSVLDEKFIRYAYGSNFKLGREMFCLDSFTRIQLNGKYNGHQLTDKARRLIGKLLVHYIPERNSTFRLSHSDKILLDVKECCDRLFRISHIKHVLPHFQRPDIIVCFDKKTKRGIQLNNDVPENYFGKILSKDIILGDNLDTLESVVVVIGGWNNFVRDTDRSTGIFQMKIDQLNILGHRTLVVPWEKWNELENSLDRKNFIKRKMAIL